MDPLIFPSRHPFLFFSPRVFRKRQCDAFYPLAFAVKKYVYISDETQSFIISIIVEKSGFVMFSKMNWQWYITSRSPFLCRINVISLDFPFGYFILGLGLGLVPAGWIKFRFVLSQSYAYIRKCYALIFNA